MKKFFAITIITLILLVVALWAYSTNMSPPSKSSEPLRPLVLTNPEASAGQAVWAWDERLGVLPAALDLSGLLVERFNVGSDTFTLIKEGDFGLSKLSRLPCSFGDCVEVEDDLVFVEGAYPSPKQPDFVWIRSTCGGSGCAESEWHLIQATKQRSQTIRVDSMGVGRIKVYQLGAGRYRFVAMVADGKNLAGDTLWSPWELESGDNVFVPSQLRSQYPGIAGLGYPYELFENVDLRKKVLQVDDAVIGDLRAHMGMEHPIKWFEGSAMMMCSAAEKGEWGNTQIIVLDLLNKGFVVQRFKEGKLVSAQSFGKGIRKNVRDFFALKEHSECFETWFDQSK